MALLYSPEKIQQVLQELEINPFKGLVNTREAARILSWRAEHEKGIVHDYPDAAVRRHVESGNLEIAGKLSGANYFKPEDVFVIPLTPRRGIAQKKTEPRLPTVKKDDAA